jgi:hypothetical protein
MIFYWNDLKCETVGPLQGLLPHLLVLFGCLIWANHQQTTVLHLGNTSRPTAMYMNLVNLYFYMVIPLKSRGDYYKFPTVWIVAVVRCRSYSFLAKMLPWISNRYFSFCKTMASFLEFLGHRKSLQFLWLHHIHVVAAAFICVSLLLSPSLWEHQIYSLLYRHSGHFC